MWVVSVRLSAILTPSPRAAIIGGFLAILLLVVGADLFARRPGSGVRPLSGMLRSRTRDPCHQQE